MIEFRYILCPIDFSDTSARRTYATAFATWYEAVDLGSVTEGGAHRQALVNIPQSVGLFPTSVDRRIVSSRKSNELAPRTARTTESW